MSDQLFGGFKGERYKYSAKLGLVNNAKFSLQGFEPSKLAARLNKAVNAASVKIADDLKTELDNALRSPVWSTPSGRADIIDTGALLASGTVTATGNGVTIAYDAPYAALVHFGGYINPYGNASSRVYLPPRPWIESVLRGGGPVTRFDFESYYREAIAKEFSR